MSATCELCFDVGSPYSYLASTQVRGIAQRTGCELKLTPVTIGGVFKALGQPQIPSAPRLDWMRKDLGMWTKKYGVPLEFPEAFPLTSTITALRTLVAVPDGPGREAAMHSLFSTYWGQGKDIGKTEVLRAALDAAGQDGEKLIARAADQDIKDALRGNTDAALKRGLFGVPTFFVGAEMFWGNDRIEFVEAALRHDKLRA